VDTLNEKIGRGITWLSTFLVLVVCYDVFTRYVLKESSVAIQELEWHLFALLFLIAAAYTLKHDRHVRVDVFYAKFSVKLKAWINFLGSLVFLIPFTMVSILASQKFVINSFVIGEKSPDPGGLPARYILKAAIPAGFFLLLLQAFSLAFKSLLSLLNKDYSSREEKT
jgi:TRAP-type mannitol/chloroaromatic compound transport system permease small subunit